MRVRFSKIKGTIYNVTTASAEVCTVLPRPADSNGLIVIKLKQDLRYRGYVYFEPVRLVQYTRHLII